MTYADLAREMGFGRNAAAVRKMMIWALEPADVDPHADVPDRLERYIRASKQMEDNLAADPGY